MEKGKTTQNSNQGITLIALVITIIILLILAGVTIAILTGEDGILKKADSAKEENQEKTATEIINLKITNAQIESYTEKQVMPNLQYLADRLCEDNEIQYVLNTSKKIANVEKKKIEVTGDFIYTKLIEYPYEFKIDASLRLDSIDGIEIADNATNQEVEELKKKVEDFQITVTALQTQIEKLERSKRNDYDYTLNQEKVIGTWYDGSPMYEVSIAFTIPSTDTDGVTVSKLIDLQEYNMKECVIYEVFFNLSNISLPIVWIKAPSKNHYIASSYDANEKGLRIANSVSGYSDCQAYATLHYSKNN